MGKKKKKPLSTPSYEEMRFTPEQIATFRRIEREAREVAPLPGVRPKIRPPQILPPSLELREKARARGPLGKK